MQKNLLQNEESLIKRLLETLRKNKKNLIRTIAGVSAAAMIATGAGCAEASQEDPYSLNEYVPKEYTSEIANDLFSSEKYTSLNKNYELYKTQNGNSNDFTTICNELNVYPICYDFFKNYYGDDMNTSEINKKVSLVCQFLDEDSNLYLQYYFDNNTGDTEEGYKNSVLLKYQLSTDIVNDLIYSSKTQDNVKNLLLLENVVNDYEYEVVAKEIINCSNSPVIDFAYSNGSVKVVDNRMVTSCIDLDNNLIYTYAVVESETDPTNHVLYRIENSLSKQSLLKIGRASNTDTEEYPFIIDSYLVYIFKDSNFGKSSIPEEYKCTKKDIIYVGDYIDNVYKGVDYTND